MTKWKEDRVHPGTDAQNRRLMHAIAHVFRPQCSITPDNIAAVIDAGTYLELIEASAFLGLEVVRWGSDKGRLKRRSVGRIRKWMDYIAGAGFDGISIERYGRWYSLVRR